MKKILTMLAVILVFVSAQAQYKIDSTDNTLKGHLDVNLGLIYTYKKNFGAFFQFSNITASAYHSWFYYPNYGFGLIDGLIVKF